MIDQLLHVECRVTNTMRDFAACPGLVLENWAESLG